MNKYLNRDKVQENKLMESEEAIRSLSSGPVFEGVISRIVSELMRVDPAKQIANPRASECNGKSFVADLAIHLNKE